jgi:hypothetical protein
MQVWTVSIAVGALALGLAAPVACRAESDAEAAADLRQRITALIGGARCNNLVKCRVIGLGSRPCGGPREYVAYSIWDTTVDEIGSLAAEYNFLREELDAAGDEVGSCEVLPEPAVNCVSSRCVTVPSRR